MTSTNWPVLRSYDGDHLERISLPLGGIGTGTVGLGGRGDLRDFELGNRPAKGFRPATALFAVRVQSGDEAPRALVAEGPLPLDSYEGAFGSAAPNHGLPRFAHCTFDAAYPLGQVHLSDDDFPLTVDLQGFSPMVLTDVDLSSIPVAVLRYRLTNTSQLTTRATVAGALSNFVGANGTDDLTGGNTNTYRTADGVAGVTMTADRLEANAEAGGSVTLALLAPDGVEVSHRTGWADFSWGNSLLDFWDDLLDDGRLEERQSLSSRPVASLAGQLTLEPGESSDLTFLLTWNFPNRRAWRSEEYGGINIGEYSNDIVGNAYSARYPDPWQTSLDVAARLSSLEDQTLASVRAVVDTDTPTEILEAALFNLSTLRSPTVFQIASGGYYGWEGVGDDAGSCFGTCTHVWGYEFATSFLYTPIARSFRETQFALCTAESGLMSFRAGLPVELSQAWPVAAADGQMSSIVHLYLDWVLTGDPTLISDLWPAAKRALEFCWIPGGWDADQDGVMEGVQHNTMDVEYYGPNPQMGALYLAALRASEALAVAAGDEGFADHCRKLFESGSRWIDENLFNGSYYRHLVKPVASVEEIAPGLRHQSMGSASTIDPDLQLGDGCLVDQLVGQYAATLAGLGDLLDPDHMATALRSVHSRNFQRSFTHHFNHMRSFVLGDEAGVVMATYDAGKRPPRPFPYFNEVMTGFEYTAAVGLLQAGATAEGLEIIGAIRSRYDGRKRNPFDEAECGHHYARAMASWSALVAWNQISYSQPTGTLTVGGSTGGSPAPGRYFWSTGSAYGTWEEGAPGAAEVGTLRVLRGRVDLTALVHRGTSYASPQAVFDGGDSWEVVSKASQAGTSTL
ncbi:MAG: GH116 family glycosyl-hydrolase [Propionibacteriaceae bacterium]